MTPLISKSKSCILKKLVYFGNTSRALCISLIEGKSPSKSEHLYGKTATIGTFFKVTMTILHKKISY